MQVKDFDTYNYRQRKPWIVWLLILVILLVAARRLHKRRSAERRQSEPAAELRELPLPDAGGDHQGAAHRAPPAVRDAARAMLAEARVMIRDDAHEAARATLLEALSTVGSDSGLRREVEDLLGAVHVEMIMTPRAMPEKIDYVVQRGDSVARIANRSATTVELVQISNRIANPNLIRAGDRLRVLNKPFAVFVNVARNELVLELDGRFFKRYQVGTGKYGRTPIGTFEISDRIPEPVWWRPDGRAIPYGDPDNILGTHWLAIRATGETEDFRGYGLHGTWENDSIGRSESAGCIRLRNKDIEEIFTLLPVGTPVTIVAGDET